MLDQQYRVSKKKVHHKVLCRFSLISRAANMLEGWCINHAKGAIHSFVWSTNTCFYDIRKPRYQQINMGNQMSKKLYFETSSFLNFDVPYCFAYILAPKHAFEHEL